MKFFKKLCAVILAASALALCGCVDLVGRFYPEDTTDTDTPAFVPVDVEEGSIYFKDFDGNVITLTEAPKSVASLSPVATEIICGIGAGRYISVINASSSKVDGAPISAEVVSDYNAETDKIIALAPKIVFYSTDSLSLISVTLLQNAGLTLVRIPEKGNVQTAESNIRFISSLMYRDSFGEKLIEEMRAEIEKMKTAADIVGVRKKVYIENSASYSAIGGDTIISELCSYAGADNVFADRPTVFLASAAMIAAPDPEAIIVLTDNVEDFNIDSVRKREGLEGVYAVRTKAIYPINKTQATRPTQNIVYALRAIGEALKVTK